MEQKNKYEDFNLDLKRTTVSVGMDKYTNGTYTATMSGCTCETSCLIENCLSNNNCISDTCSACHSYCGSNCRR